MDSLPSIRPQLPTAVAPPRGAPRRLARSRSLKALLRLLMHYAYDFRRYARASSTIVGETDRQRLEARITINYHRIEKGLALSSPHPGFGQPHLATLIADTNKYLDIYGKSDIVDTVLATLRCYYDFNKQHGISVAIVDKFLEKYQNYENRAVGGTLHVAKYTIQEATQTVKDAFFLSRHSIRQFSSEDIPDNQLDQAVQLAQHAPSVCNRQSARVYLVGGASMGSCLHLQNGNRGFGEQLARLAIVTSDQRNFVSIGERNQCWIDGGLFAMTFCYALHAQGLGTCMLNWSVENEKDKALRRLVDIPDHEVVIMMMGIGHLPDELDVARSRRLDLEDVRRFVR